MFDSARRPQRGLTVALVALSLAGCASAPTSHDTAPAPMLPVPALDSDPGYEPAAPARQTDDLAAHIAASAPARYVVQPGDTLWDIAGYYLDDPWYWPQLWQANPSIDDPDRIYPGDVLVMSRAMDGTPHVTRAHRTVRLSPRVRVEPLTAAIPVIPAGAIRNFLESPRRVTADELADAPYIVSLDELRLVAGDRARLYVRGLPTEPADRYALVRAANVYRDPATHKILGRQAIPIGEVTIDQPPVGDDIAVATLHRAYREARPGDRLLPVADVDLVRDFHPRTPARAVATHIVSVYGGISQIGQYDVVALAEPKADTDADTKDDTPTIALARGDVLDIYQAGRRITDPVAGGEVSLPERRAGRLMVFKTDDNIDYALVMQADRAIHVGDIVRSPGATPAATTP